MRQIAIILILQVSEPLTSQSIYPYINQLISELGVTGGDDRRIGYYGGIIESLFYVCEAMTVLHWSRLSDSIGRKPVLLIGMFGTIVSMLSFGLSRTFWGIVASRCFCGMLNGNIGVMKSIMGDLTDASNRAEVFGWMPVVWGLGSTLGPLIGGTLARPSDRFPSVFGGVPFWEKYPYFLPCLVTSSYTIIAWFITFFSFRETLHKQPTSHHTLLRSEASSISEEGEKTPPLRELFTYPVVVSVANYVSLAFVEITTLALLPLFMAMPIDIGGLGLPPAIIGYILGSYGIATGVFQVFFFAKFIHRFGAKRVFMFGMSTFVPLILLFPIMSLYAKAFGLQWPIWMLVGCLTVCLCLMDLAYGSIFLFVTASSDKRYLGATNGMAQTVVSISRAVGPAISTSLFSFSLERNVLGGYMVYVVLLIISAVSLYLGSYLPAKMWDEDEDDEDA
ncbi:MFS general substrate transporter [Fistulina hepatica ATCC 64428]|uniref:MFS general substrate transporter n=1 Tax=Fistulina hepatica ATCC 64428 TaxID=1128425 RepID=A0A0D7AIH2_9AGAR|nr:MFS general substrate transporter [Fistulina hepatica ATCC 64428]